MPEFLFGRDANVARDSTLLADRCQSGWATIDTPQRFANRHEAETALSHRTSWYMDVSVGFRCRFARSRRAPVERSSLSTNCSVFLFWPQNFLTAEVLCCISRQFRFPTPTIRTPSPIALSLAGRSENFPRIGQFTWPPRRRSCASGYRCVPIDRRSSQYSSPTKLGIRSSKYSMGDQPAGRSAGGRASPLTKEGPVQGRPYHEMDQPLGKP
jgi:hypothetical protein